ncbi:TPA: hypothetical protein ACVGNP_002399 [Pseudomonas aeruginosa]
MFGELLAPQYLRWLLDGFLLTLGLALLSCLLATLLYIGAIALIEAFGQALQQTRRYRQGGA